LHNQRRKVANQKMVPTQKAGRGLLVMSLHMEEREKILRRVGMKCRDFARQLSYHRALNRHKRNSGGFNLHFWTTVFNNSIDVAILDWFHLFGYHNDDLHWKQIVKDISTFRSELLATVGLDEQGWILYREKIKTYRDKDVAHIEVRPRSWVPDMAIALKAADLYYRNVLMELSLFGDYSSEPTDLLAYCKNSQEQAGNILSKAYISTLDMKEEVF